MTVVTERSVNRQAQITAKRKELGADRMMAALMDAAQEADMELAGLISNLDQRVKFLEDALVKAGQANRVTATESGIILSK